MNVSEIFGFLFDLGVDVLSSTLDKETNVITVQLGDVQKGVADSNSAEWWQHAGFCSNPAPPTAGNSACQALVLKRSDRDIVFATSDKRASKIYAQLQPGETCVYATKGMARTFYKANGAVVLYTTSDNTESGKSISLYFGPDKVQLAHQYGSFTLDSNGWSISAGQAALFLLKSGTAKLTGKKAILAGMVATITGKMSTFIGNGTATPVTGIGYSKPGPGPVASASATVFVSP